MDKYLTYGMITDAVLVTVDNFIRLSHFLLPLGGTHFSQLSLMLLGGFLYGEHRRISVKGDNQLRD